MPDKTILFLTGMPASGKTYWGEKIAQQYSLQLTDLDDFIVTHEQASMQALFAQYGEQGFREREHKHLKKVINTASGITVVACGGGTPCFCDNMQLMKAAGSVIYLEADIDTLLANLKESETARPMLNNRGDLAVYLYGLLQKRKVFYEQAHYILHAKDISLTTFGEIIASCINKQ